MRFVERQRLARRWIAFVDLADWCAGSTTRTSIEDEQRALELAYQRLAMSMLGGEFEQNRRSKVLYLDPFVSEDGLPLRSRLTREQFQIAFDATMTPPSPSLPMLVFGRCWLPCELARRWLESHGYRWAPHFEPGSSPAPEDASDLPAVGPAPPASVRAKPRPPSREKKFWLAAREAAVEWLIDNGCPAPGDGNQAALERYVTRWLEGHGHEASESAVRRHVARCIKERRVELSA
jgi:hypothetical protein